MVGGRGQVGEQARAEADEGASDVAVDEGEAEDGEQQEVRYGTRQVQPGQDADLDHQGDDDQRGGEQHSVEAHGEVSSYCSCCRPSAGAFADGVTVTVTVGVGVGLGLAGSTSSRGSLRGAWTTTPTMSSLEKDTNGVT